MAAAEPSPEKFATFFSDYWPHVQVQFVNTPRDDADFKQYLDNLMELYGRGNKFRIMFDASEIGAVSFKYILRQVDFMKKNEVSTMRYLHKCAIVVVSDMARGLVNLIFKIKPVAAPIRLFKDQQDAWNWLISDSLEGAWMPKSDYVEQRLRQASNV